MNNNNRNNNNTIIGDCSNYHHRESKYVPYISFEDSEKKNAEEYILKEVSDFFSKFLNKQIGDISQARIPTSSLITNDDFKRIDVKYFYETLFDDLGERDEQNKLIPKIKWGAVFDQRCTPISIGEVSENYKGDYPTFETVSNIELFKQFSNNQKQRCGTIFDRKYGTIDINGTPIFYYIYFTLQEILNAIR